MLFLLVLCVLIFYLIWLLPFCYLRRKTRSIAFFHPYCNACGGGERVLWRAVKLLIGENSDWTVVIFTGDVGVAPAQILERVRQRFNIDIKEGSVKFVYLRLRRLLEKDNYPYFTLVCQLFAGFALGVEALLKYCPSVFVDTTGCPLTLPLFRIIGGATTITYVHYPTITSDMIKLVENGEAAYNNSTKIANNKWLSRGKLFYYYDLLRLYSVSMRFAHIMANGSWTAKHLRKQGLRPTIVFPPCDVSELTERENSAEQILSDRNWVSILSVGQIRPEKNHPLQIRIFKRVLSLMKERGIDIKVRFIIAGGCRGAEDERRLEEIKLLAKEVLGRETSEKNVKYHPNTSFDELLELLSSSLIGLHTMWNEHFGISVVESLAAGQLMVAHNSGGPKLDIIGNGGGADGDENHSNHVDDSVPCGFLAVDEQEYAEKIVEILQMDVGKRDAIRAAARKKSERFSNEAFDNSFFEFVCSK